MSAGDAFFVDSNVLLYYVDPVDSHKQARAMEWLDQLWITGAGRLSWQVLHEFYWNAIKKMHLEAEGARSIVEELIHWAPVDSSLGLIQQAWYWADTTQVSHWDALIIAAAQRSGARYLLSEDFQTDRQYEDLRVLNPFEHAVAEFIA